VVVVHLGDAFDFNGEEDTMARVATSKHYNIDNSTNNRRDRKERYYLSLDFSYY
jgi:hypothetical protein